MGTPLKLRGLSDLVELAYEGIEESTPWKSLMERLGEVTGSYDASMVICSTVAPGMYYLVTDSQDPRGKTREHIDGVMSVNVYLETPLPKTCTADELMPDGAFMQTQLYQQFLKPLNIRHLLGCDVLRDDLVRARVSVERTADQEPFGTRERELIERLTPHLQRAMRLRERHVQGRHMQYFFEEAMAKLAIGCLMLDARGRVLSMNAWARQLIDRNDAVVIRNSCLRTVEGIDGRALAKSIELALAAHHNACRCQRGAGLRIESAPGMALLDVVIKPLISDPVLESRDSPAVVIYLNDSRCPSIDLEPGVLGAIYGFTPCESRLSALLAKGTSVEEASGRLGVSVNTIKTHLRGIYEKTGTNKQVQIVARLNHSSARLI